MQGTSLRNFDTRLVHPFVPEFYDPLWSQFQSYNENLARMCGAMMAVSKPRIALELGSGTGLFGLAVIATLQPASFIGIDRSSVMTREASERLDGAIARLICDDAANLGDHVAKGGADLIFLKSAYHHFRDKLPISAAVEYLSENGRLALIERTARSAASFPLFDEGSWCWRSYFSSLETESHCSGEVSAGTYSEQVSIDAAIYYSAIARGQLSFTWVFDQDAVRNWAEQASFNAPSRVEVIEEFSIRVFTKRGPGADPQ